MTLRRLVIAASTFVVAIVMMVVVPVAQLQVAVEAPACCCPDPDSCKCPDHDEQPTQSTMRACHKGPTSATHTPLPAFVAPARIAIATSRAPAQPIVHATRQPHPPPAPERPDGPS